MKLRHIIREEASIPIRGEDLQSMSDLSAPDIIDASCTETHRPFIYAFASPRKLYVGPEYKYHMDIISQLYRTNRSEAVMVEDVYYHSVDEGSVGRFGKGINKLPGPNDRYYPVNYPNAEIVTFYSRDDYKYAAAAVKRLIEDRYISKDAWVVHDHNVVPAAEFAQGAIAEPTPEPQTAAVPQKTQTAMRQAGLVGPGQRWWAMQSESRKG